MNIAPTNISKIAIILTLSLTTTLTSTYTLAKVDNSETVYTQQGYPYAGLVKRSELVKIVYTETGGDINCRVEVLQDGKVWQGEANTTSAKKFNQKPLSSCLNRQSAKQLLANTY